MSALLLKGQLSRKVAELGLSDGDSLIPGCGRESRRRDLADY